VFQSIKNQAVYIVPATPSGWRDSNRVNGIVPFYFKINAEDPNAPAVAVSKDDTGQPIQIKYSPGGYFEHDIDRLVWKSYNSKVRTDPTLEIDDNGRPYYTVTKDRLTLNKMPTVPQSLLIVDAQTGEIEEYDLDKVPAWVDRVYSQETVANMIDWWGHWSKAPWQVRDQKANRYKLAEDPVMVYTKSGTASYQAILTSWNSDTSASYLMTVDARTGVAKAFTIPNLTLESVARGHIVNSPGQTGRIKYHPPHMVLYRIYGQLAWLSPVEVEGDVDHVYKGVGIVSATDNSGQSAVIGTNKADALAKFRQNIAKGVGSNAPPSEAGNNRVLQGTVSWVNNIVSDGNTVFWFGLEEHPQFQFRGVPNDDILPELKTVHPGAKVKVGFLDVGSATVDVGSFDNLAVTTPPVGGKR
ncbi:MAG: hypothetical protein K0S68_445, partial [Candidatus Saccharibacteria bacterium]|nr:hypothetical protein [Candidatus Saccharibacteria bacterium]